MNDAERGIEEWRELQRMVEAALEVPEVDSDRRARLRLTEKPGSGISAAKSKATAPAVVTQSKVRRSALRAGRAMWLGLNPSAGVCQKVTVR
jgi:hypothetical protein